MQEVLVVGAGWLGTPLAVHLSQAGFQVTALGRSLQKIATFEAFGIKYIPVDYSQLNTPTLKNKNVVICIPPVAEYTRLIAQIYEALNPNFVIFTSSTSVYAQNQGVVDELSTCDGNPKIMEVEQWINAQEVPASVLRLGGLIGPNRNPVTYFSGQQELPNGLAPVNLVHQSDVLRIIELILRVSLSGIFNVVYPDHPSKKSYYERQCVAMNLPLCSFLREGTGKIVNGVKILEALNTSYLHPIG